MALIEHLEKLRHFYKITQYKSINETSQKTGYSQGGLSKSLQLLEDELGCMLFKRSRDGLSLTKEGVEVKAFAQSIFESAAGLEKRIKALSLTRAPKTLRIGMYDSIAIYFGVELSEYLRQVYPNVKLEIVADSSANLLKLIKEESLEIAIGVNFKNEREKELKFYSLFEDSYSLYCTSKSLNENIENSIIIHSNATDEEGVSTIDIFSKEVQGKRIHRTNNFETLKQLVASGLGIGILPTLVSKPLLQTGQIVPYEIRSAKKFRGRHKIGALVRHDTIASYGEFISDIIRLSDRWIKT
jgi:DNA-binding transcriptional LysR family regulator